MDKLYICETLLEFKTKKIPKNALIINIEKYNKLDFIVDIVKKLEINDIIVENKSLEKIILRILPDKNISIIDNESKIHIYQDRSIQYFLYYLFLASLTTFVFFNWTTRKYLFLIGIILLTNFIFWIIAYKFLINKEQWDNIIVYN